MSASADHAATVMQETLSGIPTNDLIAELATREGIEVYTVGTEEEYLIKRMGVEARHEVLEAYHGPIRILTVVDE